MGLFDGKVIELGETIVSNLLARADEIETTIEGLGPGESFMSKATIRALREVASVIKASTEK